MKKVWKRPGKKIPKFRELDIFFPQFSNFKIKIVISQDILPTAYYIADRDYVKEPTGLGDGTDAFTASSVAGGYSYIYLTIDADFGTIAHESYHAVKALMKFIGSPGNDDEVMAYHLGYLVNKIVEFNLSVLGKFKTKKRKKGKR